MNNEPLQKTPKTLSFKKLPPEKQEKILQMQKNPDENTFVFSEKLSIVYWLMLAASLVWFGYLFFSSQNILWEPWVFWLNAGLSLIAAGAFVFSLAKTLSFFFSKKRNGYVFTPNEFIRIEGDRVQVWNLKQLESLRVDEEQKQLETWIGEHEERLGYNDFGVAKKLEKLFDGWKLNARDDFADGCGDPKFAYSSVGKTVLIFGLSAASVILAGGLVFAANAANANYDDDVVWSLAERSGTIESLEGYKTKHPKGRHLADANQKISVMLGKIKDDYAAKPKDSANPAAVETLSAILDEITQNTDRRIFVKIKETRELDDQVIKELESDYGFDVESYEYTAPASGEDFRKGKVLTDIKLVLRDIVKDGAVELVLTDEPPADSPFIEINYLIKSARMYYAYNLYFQGKNTIKFYPGLEFNFDLVLKSGASAKEFRNTYFILPQKLKSTVFRSEDVNNYTFDKNLFSVASEDFSQQLGVNFGVAQ